MKKLIIFTISAVLCTSLFAQKENLTPHLKSTLSINQQPDSTIAFIMDNGWQPQSKLVYNYDGNSKESLVYSWLEENSSWDLYFKYLDTYNMKGDRTSRFSMALNPGDTDWDTIDYQSYIYDDVLGITSWAYDRWDQVSRNWKDFMKGEYEYSTNGREMKYLVCRWNTSYSNWDSSSFVFLHKNISGKDSSGTYFKWNSQETPRYIDYRYWMSYDENGNDTLYYQEYQANPDQKFKTVTRYNGNNSKTSETSYKWIDNAWLNMYLTEYSYDDDGNLTMYINQEWDATGQVWVPSYKEQNYYEAETGSADNDINPRLVFYPNPASEFILIRFENTSSSATFRLYNMDGARVIDQKMKDNTIQVGHLPRGVYLYQFIDEGKVFRGKVALE